MDADRRAQIIRLLETRDQHLPQPSRRQQIDPGFRHNVIAPTVCPTCEGCNSFACTGCGGRGYIERRRSRDPYAVDKIAKYGLDGSKHDRGYAIDHEIERLRQQTRPPLATEADVIADTPEYGWIRARELMYASYDFASLDRAMDMLHQVDPDACSLLTRVYEYQTLPAPHPGTMMAALIDRGLRFVDKWMPDPIRSPADEPAATVGRGPVRPEAGVSVRERRDRAMRADARNGVTVAELVIRYGVSKSTVYQVVNGAEAAA